MFISLELKGRTRTATFTEAPDMFATLDCLPIRISLCIPPKEKRNWKNRSEDAITQEMHMLRKCKSGTMKVHPLQIMTAD